MPAAGRRSLKSYRIAARAPAPFFMISPDYDRSMGQVDGPLAGLVVIALVTLICGATVGGVLYQAEIVRGLHRLVRTSSPPTPLPEGPPIERIGCDVRRLRRELLTLAPGIPVARRIGLQLAYDDVLDDACVALEVANTLTALPLGAARDAERLYVEHRLRAAGLRLHA